MLTTAPLLSFHVVRHTHKSLHHHFQATHPPGTQAQPGAVLAGLYKCFLSSYWLSGCPRGFSVAPYQSRPSRKGKNTATCISLMLAVTHRATQKIAPIRKAFLETVLSPSLRNSSLTYLARAGAPNDSCGPRFLPPFLATIPLASRARGHCS